MIMQPKKLSGFTDPTETAAERRHRKVAREAAAEGFVLLKNEGVLPILKGSKVALLGGGAAKTVKGGTGSGDVNEREVVSVWQGFRNAGIAVTSESWLSDYEKRYAQARIQWRDSIFTKAKGNSDDLGFFNAVSNTPFRYPDGRPITPEDIGEAETVIYVISRIAGEACDRHDVAGDYLLTENEKADLSDICALCPKVVVLINAGAQIDMQDILCHKEVKGVVYIAQPGMEGGNAVADVLTGKVNFSGKLTDTWAKRYSDFPNAATFSYHSGSVEKEEYQEDIYVGYRYFDTFGVEQEYSFGFGLSYTTFEITCRSIASDGKSVSVTVSVKNTGTVSGKEVVQIYAACPQEKLQKEHRRLCAFAKTELLQPDHSQTLTVSFPMKGLASFWEEQSAWVMEKGLYGIFVGNSLENAAISCALRLEVDTVLEKTGSILPLREALNRKQRDGHTASAFEHTWHMEVENRSLPVVDIHPVPIEKRLASSSEAERRAKELTEKLTDEELISMCIGNVTRGQGSALGSAGVAVPGSAGETSNILEEKYKVPGITMADGPAGLRLIRKYHVDRTSGNVLDVDFLSALEGGFFAPVRNYDNADTYYQHCTSFPVGILLAQTWNPETLQTVGKAVAEELITFGVSWWLAPGMNIHRNPLCGRNFEYYSEDPVVAGVCAAAITQGVQSMPGVGTTIKHFACNNQEDNRMGSDSVISERALREIYLRGFEISVKTAQPMCIMTSYNLINGVHAANSRDLCTVVARQEWGFQGIIMTDWTTTMGGGSVAWKCVDAGNDLIMPGAATDFESIRTALQDGSLSAEKLKACVARMLKIVYQSSGYADAVSYGAQFDCKSYFKTRKPI